MGLPTKEDFATEVRSDRLATLQIVTLVVSLIVFWLAVTFAIMERARVSVLAGSMIVLGIGCFFSRLFLRDNHYNQAAWTYGLSAIAAAALALTSSDPNSMEIVPFFFPIVVFMMGLLLHPRSTLTFALLSTAAIILVPGLMLRTLDFVGAHQIIAIGLTFATAILSAQVTGELYQITEWALMNYQRERRTNTELFEKREALQRSLKRSEALSDKLKEINVELEAAHAAAEEAKHFRGQFLANMSHELRTPLNAIIGFSETMLRFPMMYDNVPLPQIYSSDINQIYSSGRQLLHVINDILDLAKVDAGKLEIFMQKVDPSDIVSAVLSTAQGLTGSKPVELRKDLPHPMPLIWADETRLRQVLLNLYSNAVKFTDSGSITLTVREIEEGIRFSVTDTGCGIAADNLGLIFEEFKQANSFGRDPRAGAGLGLTISRQLLTLMGGRIWVESELGKGSTFHFIVPKYRDQDKTPQPSPTVPEPELSSTPASEQA